MSAARIAKLQAQLRQSGDDFAAMIPGPNLVYFTGLSFHLSERPIVLLIPAADEPAGLILPGFEAGKAQGAGIEVQIHPYADGQPFLSAFESAARAHRLDGKRIVVEATRFRALEWALLSQAAPNAHLVVSDERFAEVRMVKEPAELDAMREAVRLAERALDETLPHIHPGQTERQIASRLMRALLDLGAEGMPFSPLVQAGPTAANPHAEAGDREVQPGDLVLIDFGATVRGYHSDITRTVAVGEPDARLREAYAVVRAANEAARSAARPGVTGEAIDRAARSVIEQAGFGAYFTHRTGHGLGLEGHEPPYIVSGARQLLPAGVSFTIEPGIYLPGHGGVRIEDDVVLTEGGCESLTTFTRDLIVLPR
ncbi:MAG: Xaa-Pro peptidase family protein [Thermoflexales bacterium]|nr:Xaa-Pro peptidase family protein [Thermoflexales bacterium]